MDNIDISCLIIYRYVYIYRYGEKSTDDKVNDNDKIDLAIVKNSGISNEIFIGDFLETAHCERTSILLANTLAVSHLVPAFKLAVS